MRTFVIHLAVILSLLIALSCAQAPVRTELFMERSDTRWVEKTLGKMKLREKIGQMICCPFSGYYMHANSDDLKHLKNLITDLHIGSFILYRGNVYETARLINDLQETAKYPLLITSDLEMGLGQQLEGALLFPPLMSLGASDSEDASYLMGRITAIEARAVGIHMTFAPVLDVNINPDNPIINVRSFSEDPKLVNRLGIAFIKGCQGNGLIATAKHFPGHGDTDEDSHSVLPTVHGDMKRIESVELFPFKGAIDAGVQAIMTAHIRLPAMDLTPDLPATLSKRVMTDYLRKELGFKGILVTDAVDMGGITSISSEGDAAVKAVIAGSDLVLKPSDPYEVYNALFAAAKEGRIPRKRINDAVRRILEAKARLGLHRNRFVKVETIDRRIASPAFSDAVERIFEHSVTLVQNNGDVVPLEEGKKDVAVFSLSSDAGGYYSGSIFIREFVKRCPTAFYFYADAFTGEDYIKDAMEKAMDADVVVVGLFSRLRSGKGSAGLQERHIQLIRELVEESPRVVVLSFGSPYFLRRFPEVDAYVCVYRDSAYAQKAACKAVFAEIDVKGRLPVSIPGLYSFGDGISLSRIKE